MFSSNINLEEITRRISEFRRRAEAGIQDAACINEISSIFGDIYTFPVRKMKTFAPGTEFFRARPVCNDDTSIPLQTIRNVTDAWERPAKDVLRQGRLNRIGQGVLYCCPNDPHLAIDEARARGNNHVAIMVYRSVRAIKAAVLGGYENSALPKDHMAHVFFSFLEEEFGREVLSGNEQMYSITRTIADTFFNYPEQDAWYYRSVLSSQKFNTAFLPGKARECLELSGVMICDLVASLPNLLSVKVVVDFDKGTGEARYHSIGSDEQRRLFPEIK